MSRIFNLIYIVLLFFAAPWLIYKSWKTGKYREGWSEKFLGRCPERVGRGACIWFHAVSVGEVRLLQPLVAELQRRRPDWDIVISSTGSPHAIVHRADVEKARRARKFRPLFFIDIAVPRDIDPAVGEIEEVYLYDIDTLEQLAQEARSRRQQQIEDCERIIDAEVAKMNLPGM